MKHPSLMPWYSFFKDCTTRPGRSEAISDYIYKITLLICNAFEFVCFIVIAHELLRQYRRRVRLNMAATHGKKNTITAAGHFASWLCENIAFSFIILFDVTSLSNEDFVFPSWVALMLGPAFNYSVLPFIQIIATPDLRQYFFSFRWCTRNSGQVETSTVQVATTKV